MTKFILGVTVGALVTSFFFIEAESSCPSYTKRGVVWEGFAAQGDMGTRCFYRESVYPHRVWNGVTVK